jgi:hypothetical protein
MFMHLSVSLFSRKEVCEQLNGGGEGAGLMLQLASKADFLWDVDRLALSSQREQRIQHRREELVQK